MLILGVFSSLFCIIHCSKKRLKINITSYGAMGKIFSISFTDIKKSEGLHFLKVFTTEKLWDGFPVSKK